MRLTKTQLKESIRTIIREQLDMRSKEGRDLKDMLKNIVSAQRELQTYNDSIADIIARQSALSKAVAASQNELLKKMSTLDVKTVQIADAVATIDQEAKYKRVAPSYQDLYERAISALSSFSMEQVSLIEEIKQTEIIAKKAEQKTILSIRSESRYSIREGIMDKVISWFQGKLQKLTSLTSRATQKADIALDVLTSLSREI